MSVLMPLARDQPELPRRPTGKLYKRLRRDRSWGNKTSRIVQVGRARVGAAGRE